MNPILDLKSAAAANRPSISHKSQVGHIPQQHANRTDELAIYNNLGVFLYNMLIAIVYIYEYIVCTTHTNQCNSSRLAKSATSLNSAGPAGGGARDFSWQTLHDFALFISFNISHNTRISFEQNNNSLLYALIYNIAEKQNKHIREQREHIVKKKKKLN